jgi:hypothetical protein
VNAERERDELSANTERAVSKRMIEVVGTFEKHIAQLQAERDASRAASKNAAEQLEHAKTASVRAIAELVYEAEQLRKRVKEKKQTQEKKHTNELAILRTDAAHTYNTVLSTHDKVRQRLTARLGAAKAQAADAAAEARAIAEAEAETSAQTQAALHLKYKLLQAEFAAHKRIRTKTTHVPNTYSSSTLYTDKDQLASELRGRYTPEALNHFVGLLVSEFGYVGGAATGNLTLADVPPRLIREAKSQVIAALQEHLSVEVALKIRYGCMLSREQAEALNHLLFFTRDPVTGTWSRLVVDGVKMVRLPGRHRIDNLRAAIAQYFSMETSADGMEAHLSFVKVLEHELGTCLCLCTFFSVHNIAFVLSQYCLCTFIISPVHLSVCIFRCVYLRLYQYTICTAEVCKVELATALETGRQVMVQVVADAANMLAGVQHTFFAVKAATLSAHPNSPMSTREFCGYEASDKYEDLVAYALHSLGEVNAWIAGGCKVQPKSGHLYTMPYAYALYPVPCLLIPYVPHTPYTLYPN